MITFLIVALVIIPVAWALGYQEGRAQGRIDAYSRVKDALSINDAWSHIDTIRFL